MAVTEDAVFDRALVAGDFYYVVLVADLLARSPEVDDFVTEPEDVDFVDVGHLGGLVAPEGGRFEGVSLAALRFVDAGFVALRFVALGHGLDRDLGVVFYAGHEKHYQQLAREA